MGEPIDARLFTMSNDELILTARLVAGILKHANHDPNPTATADMLDVLADRLEESS